MFVSLGFLFSHTNFAKSHFQLTAAAHAGRIVSISLHKPPEIQSVDLEALLNNDYASLDLNNFLIPRSDDDFPFQIKGSCRGFLFLHGSSNICIWNPYTGFHKQIPLSPFYSISEVHYFDHLYGFGYDPSRDDYMVVSMSYEDTSFADNLSHLECFSLRDNMWKEIEDAHFPFMVYGCL